MENADIIKRCQLGDLSSFNDLYQLYGKKALGTAYLISSHRGIAEDIVQEAFIQCFKEIKNIKTIETFEVWFYKILVRIGWKMVRKHSYFIPMEDDHIEGLSKTINLKSGLESVETSMTVNEAIEKLSLPLKTVVVLFHYNDMSIKEISEVLGCFQGTVKSRLHNARKQLFYELYGAFNENELEESMRFNFKKKELKIDGNQV